MCFKGRRKAEGEGAEEKIKTFQFKNSGGEAEMEKAQATLRDGDKVILENIEVEFGVTELSPGHKLLQGRFTPRLDKFLAPGSYELLLQDGRSYPIFIKGVRSNYKAGAKAFFIGEVKG